MAGSWPGRGRTIAVARCSTRQVSQRTARSLPCSVFSGMGRVLRVRHRGQVQLISRMEFMAVDMVTLDGEKRMNVV
jgi:hypothetical protein